MHHKRMHEGFFFISPYLHFYYFFTILYVVNERFFSVKRMWKSLLRLIYEHHLNIYTYNSVRNKITVLVYCTLHSQLIYIPTVIRRDVPKHGFSVVQANTHRLTGHSKRESMFWNVSTNYCIYISCVS